MWFQSKAEPEKKVDDFKPLTKDELFPPRGSEAAKMQTAEWDAKETLEAIYFDLNAYGRFQKDAKSDDCHSISVVENLRIATVSFMEHEFATYMACLDEFREEHGEYQTLEPKNRFCWVVFQIGWKMLAICAHSEAFRRVFREADDRHWGCLIKRIKENELSIEIFAHSRELDWCSLIKNANGNTPGLPPVQDALDSALQWKIDHPHHTFLTLDGQLKEPEFEGVLQTHIDASTYESHFNKDPTAKSALNSLGCYICGSQSECGCALQTRAGELVELVEYPDVGVGARTLTSINRGDILGIFIGELVQNHVRDSVYPLTQSSDGSDRSTLCFVAPHQFGNWTRFVNHSCQPSTQFHIRTIGDRVVTTIEAMRHIKAFEEVTLDYGKDYWSDPTRKCACGHWNCCSKKDEN